MRTDWMGGRVCWMHSRYEQSAPLAPAPTDPSQDHTSLHTSVPAPGRTQPSQPAGRRPPPSPSRWRWSPPPRLGAGGAADRAWPSSRRSGTPSRAQRRPGVRRSTASGRPMPRCRRRWRPRRPGEHTAGQGRGGPASCQPGRVRAISAAESAQAPDPAGARRPAGPHEDLGGRRPTSPWAAPTRCRAWASTTSTARSTSAPLLSVQANENTDVVEQFRSKQGPRAPARAATRAAERAARSKPAVQDRLGDLNAAFEKQQAFAARVDSRLDRALSEADSLASIDSNLSSTISAKQAEIARALAAQRRRRGSGPGGARHPQGPSGGVAEEEAVVAAFRRPSPAAARSSASAASGSTSRSPATCRRCSARPRPPASTWRRRLPRPGRADRGAPQQLQLQQLRHLRGTGVVVQPADRPARLLHARKRSLAIDFTQGGSTLMRQLRVRLAEGQCRQLRVPQPAVGPWRWSTNGNWAAQRRRPRSPLTSGPEHAPHRSRSSWHDLGPCAPRTSPRSGRPPEASRRRFLGLSGAVGGAVTAAALAGCTEDVDQPARGRLQPGRAIIEHLHRAVGASGA